MMPSTGPAMAAQRDATAIIRPFVVGELYQAAAAIASVAGDSETGVLLVGLLVSRAAVISRGEVRLTRATERDLVWINEMEGTFERNYEKAYGHELSRTQFYPYTNEIPEG